MDEIEDKQKVNKKSNEIDIVGIIKKVTAERKLLVCFVSAFAVLGVIVALNTPKSYTSTVILAPEISGAGGLADNISDFASMVGVNINTSGSSVDAIYPEIYPDVVSSSDFIVKLFDVKVKQLKDPTEKTYYQHLKTDNKVPFWYYPQIWVSKLFTKNVAQKPKALDPFMLTKEQYAICSIVRANISCVVDKKTSVITISVKDIDPMVSALIADTLQQRLQQYISVYRTKKARNDLEYSKKIFSEAKVQYLKAQQDYGSYADANEELTLESFKAKRDELENEMQLRYNIYNQSAQQLQLAKSKVQERTPAFSIVQGASVPLRATSTPRSMIVLLYMVLGAILDGIWVLVLRDFVKKHLKTKKE
jgi:uncharacterized protein involved in exopolysaccharide biosynthesis